MINIEYKPDTKQFSNAALVYIENNRFIKFLLFNVSFTCWIALFGFSLKLMSNSITISDMCAFIFASTWLTSRQRIHRYILEMSLQKKKIRNLSANINISKSRISWQNTNKSNIHILWQHISTIYNIKTGYIIPKVLRAPLNSTFIWLPKHKFMPGKEQEFIKLLQEHKVKLKKIK